MIENNKFFLVKFVVVVSLGKELVVELMIEILFFEFGSGRVKLSCVFIYFVVYLDLC